MKKKIEEKKNRGKKTPNLKQSLKPHLMRDRLIRGSADDRREPTEAPARLSRYISVPAASEREMGGSISASPVSWPNPFDVLIFVVSFYALQIKTEYI